MSSQVFPTKGNLIATKKSLDLAELGYDLLDRKRNILVREMMSLIDSANALQSQIDETYNNAYKALQAANVSNGICYDIAQSVPIEDSVSVEVRSVMGVSLPNVKLGNDVPPSLHYGFENSNALFDEAYLCFDKVKKMTVRLAEIENSIYRLAVSIKKTQKRSNALKNIMIPRFTGTVKFISASLEEREREEFSRQKVIKTQKQMQKAAEAE